MNFNKKNSLETQIISFLESELCQLSKDQFIEMVIRFCSNQNLTSEDLKVINRIEELINSNFNTTFFSKKFFQITKQKEMH